MKFAPVVSPSLLPAAEGEKMHMALAHLVLSNQEYARFYRRERERGSYVILDNGAWEGAFLCPERLRAAADLVNASEVILPDRIRDAQRTREVIVEALPEFESFPGRLAVVIQGDGIASWWGSLKYVCTNAVGWGVSTIMIPKHIEKFFGSRMRMFNLTIPMRLFPTFLEYHALGFEKELPQNYALRKVPFIRSIDSASPTAAACCSSGVLAAEYKTSSRFMWDFELDENDLKDEMIQEAISLARSNIDCTRQRCER